MELSEKKVIDWKLLIIFPKRSIWNVLLGSEYASGKGVQIRNIDIRVAQSNSSCVAFVNFGHFYDIFS